MINKVLSTYILVDLLFLVAGGLLLVVALLNQSKIGDEETVQNIAQLLLISQSPLIGSLILSGTSHVKNQTLTLVGFPPSYRRQCRVDNLNLHPVHTRHRLH